MTTLDDDAYRDVNVHVQQLEQESRRRTDTAAEADVELDRRLNGETASPAIFEQQKQETLKGQTNDSGTEDDGQSHSVVSVTEKDTSDDQDTSLTDRIDSPTGKQQQKVMMSSSSFQDLHHHHQQQQQQNATELETVQAMKDDVDTSVTHQLETDEAERDNEEQTTFEQQKVQLGHHNSQTETQEQDKPVEDTTQILVQEQVGHCNVHIETDDKKQPEQTKHEQRDVQLDLHSSETEKDDQSDQEQSQNTTQEREVSRYQLNIRLSGEKQSSDYETEAGQMQDDTATTGNS